jgi:hypothetical protein
VRVESKCYVLEVVKSVADTQNAVKEAKLEKNHFLLYEVGFCVKNMVMNMSIL